MSSQSANPPTDVNWDALTTEARWTIRHIATPLMEGDTLTEITETTGLSRKEINDRIVKLRQEIRRQTANGIATGPEPAAVVQVIYTRDIPVEATDLELARWRIEARRHQLTVEQWLRQLANQAAA